MKRFAWPLTLAFAAVSGTALANGRYPIANQLVVSPGDAKRLVLRTTFGLVSSQDQGKTFQWVCEKAAGFVNNEDPPIEVTQDSSILVASSQALNVSHDGGCGWQTALDELSIIDADVDASQPKRAVAVASLYMNGKTSSGLEETLDNGATWATLGVPFDGLPATVAIAPSQPTRIYASGTAITDLTPLISRSDDNGAHWQSYPLSMEQITVPFLAAVDPAHPEVVYVRAPTAAGTDVLVVSSDSGQHFKTIFKAKGGLYGFALSPDGTQVAVGGPSDPLSVASAQDYTFKPVSALLPLCLKWSAAGLYACADEAKAEFSLGLSVDAGVTFKALFRKPALTLLACPTSTQTGQYCPQAWVGQQATLGIDAGAPQSGGSGGATALESDAGATEPPDGGAVASAGESGTAASGAPSSAGATASTAQSASSSSSCALTISRAAEGSRNALLVCLGFGFLYAVQRRRPR
jgi:hypothetical protein